MARRRIEKSNNVIKKWQTALYLRLLREDETIGRSLSIKHQENMLQDYINKFEMFNTYVDDGISGRNDNRPAF